MAWPIVHRPRPVDATRSGATPARKMDGDRRSRGGWCVLRTGTHVGRGCSVLVAEDNEINQIVVQQMLELAGLRVTVVADGAAAFVHVHARPDGYDAVLMDVHMPGMDGHAATRALRVLWPALPVIGVTADAMAEDLQRCLDAGMVEVLTEAGAGRPAAAALGRHARRRAAT